MWNHFHAKAGGVCLAMLVGRSRDPSRRPLTALARSPRLAAPEEGRSKCSSNSRTSW
jgi:hypothetical protein